MVKHLAKQSINTLEVYKNDGNVTHLRNSFRDLNYVFDMAKNTLKGYYVAFTIVVECIQLTIHITYRATIVFDQMKYS